MADKLLESIGFKNFIIKLLDMMKNCIFYENDNVNDEEKQIVP
jgi:hypothetical protein